MLQSLVISTDAVEFRVLFSQQLMGSLGWATCNWCWRWEFNMYITDWVGAPLCDRCMDLEEPPWWPNHRQRCELLVWYCFGRNRNCQELPALDWDACCAIASFVAEQGRP